MSSTSSRATQSKAKVPASNPFQAQLQVRFADDLDVDVDVGQWLLHSTVSRDIHTISNPWATSAETSTAAPQPTTLDGAHDLVPDIGDTESYLAHLSTRIHTLATTISSTRSLIDTHRAHLATLCAHLSTHSLLSPDLQHAATSGVSLALTRTGNPDTLVSRARRAALLHATAPLGIGAAMGGAVGVATGAVVSGLVTVRMLARGLIGPAALAGLAGVGPAPLVAGVAAGGAVAAGAWALGRQWARGKHQREAEECVRGLRHDRDAMLLLHVAVASVRKELGGLVAAVDKVGVDEAKRLGLVEQALERLSRADLHAEHQDGIRLADDGHWVAPFEVDLATESIMLLEQPASVAGGEKEEDSSDPDSDEDGETQESQVLIGSTTLAWSSSTHSDAKTTTSTKKSKVLRPKPVQPPPEDASMAASWMLVSKLSGSAAADAAASAPTTANAAAAGLPVTPVVAPADNAQKEWAAL